jgi:hypothetical protein
MQQEIITKPKALK